METVEKSMHFWVNSEVEDLFDNFAIEEGSIKRNIRLDLINEEYYSNLKMSSGDALNMEMTNGEITGIELSDSQPMATIEAFQRNESIEDSSFGMLLIFPDGTVRQAFPAGTFGQSPEFNQMCADTIHSMLCITTKVQKFLEEKGIISSNPENDKENLDVYVHAENGEIVGQVISDTSGFNLVTYKED